MSASIYQTAIIYIYNNLCSPTLKSYVGFTTNFKKRKRSHRYNAKIGVKGYFYNAIRKDGWDNFHCFILDQSDDIEYARNVLEPLHIKLCKSFWDENGYNLTLGGGGTFGHVHIGQPHTTESKAKLSKARKGMKFHKEWKANMSKSKLRLANPSKDVLVDLYCVKKLGGTKIARIFEVSPPTVRNWLRNYEIPVRKSSREK